MKTLKDINLQFTSTSRLKGDDIEYVYSAAIGNIRSVAKEWIKLIEEYENYKQPSYPDWIYNEDKTALDHNRCNEWERKNKKKLYETIIEKLPKEFGCNAFIYDDEYNWTDVVINVLKNWIKHFFNLEEDD